MAAQVELGDITVDVLQESTFALDGGAMFGVVPRVLWEKTDPPDEKNRVALACNVAVIRAHGAVILVDTGMGESWSEKERTIYRLSRSRPLSYRLAGLDVEAEEVDFVVNTHLHFDHAGGNTETHDGRTMPAFPRARYVVQDGELSDARNAHERNRASYRAPDWEVVAEAGQLDAIAGEREIVPGVRVIPTGGHTTHHQMVRVDGGGQTLVIPSDLLPTSSHLPLPFIMGFDLHPVDTLEAKRRLLAEAEPGGWWMVFYHDARTPLGRVRREGERYALR
ncbi:MAG TPA: MBL fold metallo-hydrolase [Vicinamibacteria bacterium]|nr:MBL fold metallo-hydrolase [Vicinamibacteria bacterium]